MSIRHFCDCCGKEVKQNKGSRVYRIFGRFAVEIMTRVDGVWNAGDLCDTCVLRIANEGEPFELSACRSLLKVVINDE